MSSHLQNLAGLQKRNSIALLRLLAIGLTALFCLPGCGKDIFKTLGELATLRNELIAEFHEQNLDVTLQNSNNLAVTFVNSPLNATPDQLFRRAQETATFIKRHYAGIDRLESILVRFFKQEKRMLDSFVFGK